MATHRSDANEPRAIPADVTVPVPLPSSTTLSVTAMPNVAVTARSALMATVHGWPWPAHAPLQLANAEPVTGVARTVTTVPLTYASEQSLPQAMPAGVDFCSRPVGEIRPGGRRRPR